MLRAILITGLMFLLINGCLSYGIASEPLKVVDCPDNLDISQPSRVILQIIDNVFYKWSEYDLNESGEFCIVMHSPYERKLSAKEAGELLKASNKWIEQFSAFAELSPQVVIGDDDRQKVSKTTVFPTYTVGLLEMSYPLLQGKARGTGFLVGPYTILTAAHCVYSKREGGYATKLTFSPGRYEDRGRPKDPFKTRDAVLVVTNYDYVVNENNMQDYGAALIDKKFDQITTYVPLAFNYNLVPGQTNITIVGYPLQVREETNSSSMWISFGKVTYVNEEYFRHDADTSGGNSGSPVWVLHEGRWLIIGIHFGGDETEQANFAVKLGATNQGLIEKWMQWTPEKLKENSPPQAKIDVPGPIALVGHEIPLDGSRSFDPDGAAVPVSFQWKLIKKPAGSGVKISNSNKPLASCKLDKPGEFVFELTVTDKLKQTSKAQITIRAVALGLLIAGTSSPGKVYAYRGGSSWELISGELGFAVLNLIVYNGVLYAGVMSSSSRYGSVGRLYRYDGGMTWTLVGDNLDNQVSCLVVYKGKLFIGTSWNGGRLYQYDGPGRFVLVVDHRDPGGWRGFRSAFVWKEYLYLGDINYDIIGRYDGDKFEHIVHLGGSCIYDFALYKNALYAGAWRGSLYYSSAGTKWEKVTVEGLERGMHLWELEVFKNKLFMGFDSGKLQSFDGKKVETVWIAPTSIISMVTDGKKLYLGTGGEAGYLGRTSGEGKVYVYDGKSVVPISDRLGVGVQVLYLVSSGAKTSPAEVEQIKEPLCLCSLVVKNVPNPIRDVQSTTFVAEGVDAELIRVEVYDLTGKLVWKGEGSGNELTWHTEDLSGLPLANGVYLYTVFVKVGEIWVNSDVQKLVILR